MKHIIYIILFIILSIYIYKQSNVEKFNANLYDVEKFDANLYDVKKVNADLYDDTIKYQSPNPYNIMTKQSYKQIFNNEDLDNIVAYNENSTDLNYDNTWIIKSSGYSDIFNDEDIGSNIINNILNYPKPKILLDKTMINIEQTLLETPLKTPLKTPLETPIQTPLETPLKTPLETPIQKKEQEIKVSSYQSNIDNALKVDPSLYKNKYPLEIIYKNQTYNLLGFTYNTFYEQYYLIYEFKIRQINHNLVFREVLDNFDIQVYKYALVKNENNNHIVKYVFGPRSKVNINDIVYFNKGIIQIGPLLVGKL
jgi:hypothetical protein